MVVWGRDSQYFPSFLTNLLLLLVLMKKKYLKKFILGINKVKKKTNTTIFNFILYSYSCFLLLCSAVSFFSFFFFPFKSWYPLCPMQPCCKPSAPHFFLFSLLLSYFFAPLAFFGFVSLPHPLPSLLQPGSPLEIPPGAPNPSPYLLLPGEDTSTWQDTTNLEGTAAQQLQHPAL